MKGRLPVINNRHFSYGHIHLISTGEGATCEHGAFCSFASNIRVMLGGHHALNYITTYPFGSINTNIFGTQTRTATNRGNVTIGNDVWIGDNATIMAGVVIGNGAVIGCNAVVTEDVEPYSVVAGNPGRFIRFRFSEEIIRELQDLRWWDLPLDIIQKIVPYLMSADIETNIPIIKQIVCDSGYTCS